MMEMNNHINHVSADRQDAVSLSSASSSRSSIVNITNKVREFPIEKCFNKRQCSKFVPNGESDRCVCGHNKRSHCDLALTSPRAHQAGSTWQALQHTTLLPTDAFGQIDFQGGSGYATKAQYVRLEHQTSPDRILRLLLHHWMLELPKLLISVHGGIANFDLQPKLKRVFNKGLIKAANTTGAWIITGGTNTGVMRHVGAALAEKSMKKRKKHIVAIGIAPWGVVHKREDLIGKDKTVDYHAAAHPKNNTAVLNGSHNYFLLADNGTEGKYGADIVLRKKLERYISHQRIHIRGEKPAKGFGVPIVCVVLEGGSNTIRTVLDYLTGDPPVPVVVCDGSGRAADLLAFVHKYTSEEGKLPPMLKNQLVSTIRKTFSYNEEAADRLFYELILCMKQKHLITVFRMGEQCQDIDLPILTALLTSHNTSAPHQLNLALSWDRVDVARSHIFTYGQEWPEGSLQQAMLDALVQNKVDFVELLLEKGVNMTKFLTISTMEELYNTKIGSTSTLHMMLRDVRKNRQPNSRVTLLEVGEVIEKLMGGAYRSRYCRRSFKSKYYQATQDKYSALYGIVRPFLGWQKVGNPNGVEPEESPFPYPFSDLMIWAVLLKRQKMAKFMWRREEEALVKAIVACKLYKTLAREAIDEPLVDNEVSKELSLYAKEFQKLAVDILDHCYKEDDEMANQLLTYELKQFSNQTCISLAHSTNLRDFISHPCCQTLITDMWMGGLRMNKSSPYKVILGILVPPTILSLDFKTKEELQLLPQTVEEHIEELEDGDESSIDSDSEQGKMDADSVIENYAEHADEVNNLITWAPVNESETPAEADSDKSNELPDSSFFNSNAMMKLRELRRKELKHGKKMSEFYKAPVTKFWMHTMAYLIFLCLYTYLLLVKLEDKYPSWMEVYVIVYIFFHGVEMIREIVVSEPVKFSHKIAIFFGEIWNLMDAISLPIFWVAVALRFQKDEEIFLVGRVLYCVNIIFWYVRLLDLFAVSKNLGPYVVIIGKLVMDMLNFIVILLIVLMSFGVARQALRNPYAEPSWQSVRDIFMEPYFMLYGEVYAPDIDPECGPGTDIPRCLPGRWITPAIMSAYLLVANILLLNLLIAVFNNTYQKTSQNSREIWMFQRYSLTLEYEIKPIAPAPLILFSFIYLICKWIYRRCKAKPKIQDYGLKLFLNEEEVRKLHDFEEDCVDDYFNTLELQFESSTEERIRATNQRVENIMLKIDDMNQKENQVKLTMQTMDMRLSNLEELEPTRPAVCRQGSADTWYDSEPYLELAHSGYEFLQNVEQTQRLQQMLSLDSRLPPGMSNPTVDRFLNDSASSGQDGGSMISPPANRAQYYNHRSRSNSGDDDINRPRFGRQRNLSDGARSSLLRRRRGKELKPIKTSGSNANLNQNAEVPDFCQSLNIEVPTDAPPNYVSAAALPSIEETRNTPTDELSSTSHISQQANFTACSSAGVTHHKKLTAVQSLPIPTTNYGPREGEMSSLSSSPYVGTQSPRSSLTSPRCYSTNYGSQPALNSEQLGMAFTPVKSSLRNEYTSITDAIDTSCVHFSPESSPTAGGQPSNRFFFGPNMDSGDAESFFPATSTAKQLMRQETQVLRNAEEHETKMLGSSIRKRIRQISIDEGDAMSDLAQMWSNLETPSPGGTVDGQELSSTLPANHFKTIANNNMDDLSQSNHF